MSGFHSQLRSLYRVSIREAKSINNINIKQYALRNLRTNYSKNKTIENNSQKNCIQFARNDSSVKALDTLDLLKRYNVISKLYYNIDYHTKVIEK